MQKTIIAITALAAQAYAQSYTPPTDATFGALYTPDLSSPVTQGETYKVTWDATGHTSSTVSLVLCRGGSNNCVNDANAIVSKIPAASESYEWDVPCSLPAGKQATSTGYGMLIIEDGTGVFQYSTQFSVLENPKCGGSSGSSSTSTGSSSSSGSPSSTPSGKPGSIVTSGAYNGTGSFTERPGWDSSSTAVVISTTMTGSQTGIPTEAPTPEATATASQQVTFSTATQPTRPATQTALSGAGKNAAGMLFLVAMGAAFLL